MRVIRNEDNLPPFSENCHWQATSSAPSERGGDANCKGDLVEAVHEYSHYLNHSNSEDPNLILKMS